MKLITDQVQMSWALKAVERPVFVVGTMRSGTGFAGLRLNESSTLIGCPFELRRIWLNEGNVPMASDICGSDCPQLFADYRTQIPVENLKSAFAKEVIKNVRQKKWSSQLRFLSKNPHLCNKIGLVSEIFPQAQYVWTIRNMKDVVCSLKNLFEREEMCARGVQHIWPERKKDGHFRCFSVNRNALNEPLTGNHIFPGGSIHHLAEYWLESNLSMLEFYTKNGSSNVTILSHDLLMREPDKIATQLRKFLKLTDSDLRDIGMKVDKKLVKHWKNPLSRVDSEELEAFALRHKSDIDRIFKVVNNIN